MHRDGHCRKCGTVRHLPESMKEVIRDRSSLPSRRFATISRSWRNHMPLRVQRAYDEKITCASCRSVVYATTRSECKLTVKLVRRTQTSKRRSCPRGSVGNSTSNLIDPTRSHMLALSCAHTDRDHVAQVSCKTDVTVRISFSQLDRNDTLDDVPQNKHQKASTRLLLDKLNEQDFAGSLSSRALKVSGTNQSSSCC